MVSNEAERRILHELLNSTDLDPTVRLFKNDPAAADAAIVLTDLEEADFDGYAALTAVAWDAVATNGSGQAETISEVLSWERTAGAGGSQTVYGIYITFTSFDTNERLMWFARFASPFTFGTVGTVLEKTINWKAENLA